MQATIYGVISTLDKYSIEDAKRLLFQMLQERDAAHDTEVRRLKHKAEVFDQLDAYGCSSASIWLEVSDRIRELEEALGIGSASRKAGSESSRTGAKRTTGKPGASRATPKKKK